MWKDNLESIRVSFSILNEVEASSKLRNSFNGTFRRKRAIRESKVSAGYFPCYKNHHCYKKKLI